MKFKWSVALIAGLITGCVVGLVFLGQRPVRYSRSLQIGDPSIDGEGRPADRTESNWTGQLAALDSTGIARLWDELYSQGASKAHLRRILINRWLDVDPSEAFQFLRQRAAESDLSYLLKVWAMVDFDSASAARKRLAREDAHYLSAESSTRNLALHHPRAFLDQAPNGWSHTGESDHELAFRALFEQDRDEALSRMKVLKGSARQAALSGIALGWAAESLDSAMQWAKSLPDRTDRDAALGSVLRIQAKSDPEAVVPLLEDINNPFEFSANRYGPGSLIVQDLMRSDPDRAFEWVATHFDLDTWRDSIVTSAIQTLLNERPDAVASSVAGIANDWLRQAAIADLADYSSARNYDVILKGVDSLEPGEIKERIRSSIVRTMAADDAYQAAEYVQSLGEQATPELWGNVLDSFESYDPSSYLAWKILDLLPEDSRQKASVSMIRNIASTDPAKAAHFLESVSGDVPIAELVSGVAAGWVRLNLQEAQDWVEQLDPGLRAGAAEGVAQSIAVRDGPAAMQWIESLKLSEIDTQRVASQAYTYWLSADKYGAETFLEATPSGQIRDGATYAMATQSAFDDAEKAMTWAVQIKDSTLKAEAQKQIESAQNYRDRMNNTTDDTPSPKPAELPSEEFLEETSISFE
ncbi:MAG: hypothetical protein R3F19_18915 [Verrucomicrobiales bacterium]